MRFSLGSDDDEGEDGHPRLILPLLTTKRVHHRAIILELLWFISGRTSSRPLSDQGVKIWDGNGSRAYLDSIGLHDRVEGDLGPVYGFQWRHFGATYLDAQSDYTGQGVDQLKHVLDRLRHHPYDRRIILSAWNPAHLHLMALPPCHLLAQFYIESLDAVRGGVRHPTATTSDPAQHVKHDDAHPDPDHDEQGQSPDEPGIRRGRLHCQLYQRSCDIGLGVPFNIASYALLTHMLAHVCDLIPGTFTFVMGDAHIYRDHQPALERQLTRDPRPFPTLVIRRPKTFTRSRPGSARDDPATTTSNKDDRGGQQVGQPTDLDDWSLDDFDIRDYQPHPAISMNMSV